jgi:hypothetical protein
MVVGKLQPSKLQPPEKLQIAGTEPVAAKTKMLAEARLAALENDFFKWSRNPGDYDDYLESSGIWFVLTGFLRVPSGLMMVGVMKMRKVLSGWCMTCHFAFSNIMV